MLRLGNTEINALGNNINKAYLGAIEVFGSVFTSLWETTTASETITLPTPTNYRVDWGDGTVTTNTNSHEYLTANQYTIKISGEITDFKFNNGGDKTKILEISKFGNFTLVNSGFYGCLNLDITANETPKTVTGGINDAFRGCSLLIWNISVNSIDTSVVLNIDRFFNGATIFNESVNNWDVGNKVSLVQIFASSGYNQPLNGWNVSSCLSLLNLFFRARDFNQSLSSWNTSLVENMQGTFRDTDDFNQDISTWSFVSVTRMNDFMFGKGAEYDTTYMDNLYIKLDQDLVFANMVNVNISFGSINFTSAGATARASLVSKGFIITSGIQV